MPTRSSPLACCNRSTGTTSGTKPSIAGANTAVAVPATTASRHIAVSGACPVSTIAASPAYAPAPSTSATTISFDRDIRSAITPPARMNTSCGTA
ncbi:hypothetical protein OHA27_35645 [Streptomyces sp. NBC_01619]|nr:hypothetical protein [Streptomyces sp. NBC_01619]